MVNLNALTLPEYTFNDSIPVILSGYGFSASELYLVADQLSGEPVRRFYIPVAGRPIHLAVTGEKYCTGRYSITTFESEPCPHQEKLAAGDSICYSCFQAIGFNPAFYNVSRYSLSPQQQAYNLEPHVLYITAFGKEKIKVGISSERRFLTRLLEQGALCSIVIKNFENAYDARWHEHDINKQFNLPETIRSSVKRKLLTAMPETGHMHAELLKMKDAIYKSYNWNDRPWEFYDFLPVYFGKNRPGSNWIDVTDNEPKMISGMGFGLAGDVLIVTQNEIQYMLSLKAITGYKILLKKEIIAMDNSDHQLSLF